MQHALVLLVLTLFISFPISAAVDNAVIATIGNKTITLTEFNKKYDEVRKAVLSPPSRKAFLEDLVRFEVGVQEAEKQNIAKDPKTIERLRQALYVGLAEKELGDKVAALKISPSEMEDYYKSNPQLRTSHILIQLKQNATAEEKAVARKRAEEIASEVRASKRPFEELVKLYTDDILTKNIGGDTGYQASTTVAPAYYNAASRLKVGEISNVVEAGDGFHIIKLTGRLSFGDSYKQPIRDAIFEKKRLDVFNDYFDKLKRNYKISVKSELLK